MRAQYQRYYRNRLSLTFLATCGNKLSVLIVAECEAAAGLAGHDRDSTTAQFVSIRILSSHNMSLIYILTQLRSCPYESYRLII
jgi:hypothetical protein